ncbi:MAG: 50S ribosomal protein L10 [Candidatus Omnitrophica bacterium]|nr:50S ribosomal protein L10 [Candidatus Omnitrophota bacterium]
MPRLEKELMIKELVGKFQGNKNIIITNFNKLGMLKLQNLRCSLKNCSAKYIVVKNSIAMRAFKSINLDRLGEFVSGTVGIGFGSNDPIGISKIIVNFSKNNETFNILGGYIDGEFLNLDRIKEIADIPSKEVLIVRLLGVLNGPIYEFYGIFNNLLRQFIFVLAEIEKKKSKEKQN